MTITKSGLKTISQKDINKLKNLINSSKQQERECAKLLEEFAYILTSHLVGNIRYFEKELITSSGRYDLIIFAECEEEVSGRIYNTAYIWELKAPQLNVYDIAKPTRGQPSISLWEAENQLIYYHYELKLNGRLQDLHKVAAEHVYLGGIIIGSKDRVFKISKKTKLSKDQGKRLSDEIHKIRKTYIPKDVQILTWDDIINKLEKFKSSKKKVSVFSKGKLKVKKPTKKVITSF